jgi:hypothetical protein
MNLITSFFNRYRLVALFVLTLAEVAIPIAWWFSTGQPLAGIRLPITVSVPMGAAIFLAVAVLMAARTERPAVVRELLNTITNWL